MSLIDIKASTWSAEDTILVNIVDDLRKVVKLSGVIMLKGHSNIKDGGGGEFTFDPLLLRTDDNNGTIVAPDIELSPGNGCWARRFNNQEYTLEFFGSSDTSRNNLLGEYGTDGALVNIVEAGTITPFVFDSELVDSPDFIDNYNGWIKQAVIGTGSVIWKNEYIAGTQYQKDDMVRDGAWTMIANTDTTDRPAPQPVGDAFYNYEDGNELSETVSAKQIVYGLRTTSENRGFLNGYRLKTIAGVRYAVSLITDPLVNPVENELQDFESESTGWSVFNISPILVAQDETYDLVVRVTVNGAPTNTTNVNYDYTVPLDSVIPLTGQISHGTNSPDTMKAHNVGSDGSDNSAVWAAIAVGDTIDGLGGHWTVQYKVNQTTYWDIIVAPAVTGTIGTGVVFTISTTASSSITYEREIDYWLNKENIQGLFAQDGGYNAVLPDETAYMIDIQIQEASISPNWDVVAVTEGTAGSGGGGGGFTDHLLNSHIDTNLVNPVDGATVTWNAATQLYEAIKTNESGLGMTDMPYEWSIPVNPAPTAGDVSTDHLDPLLVTKIYFNQIDAAGVDRRLYLETMKDGDWVNLHLVDDSLGLFASYDIVGSPSLVGNIWTIPCIYYEGTGVFSNNEDLMVTWRNVPADYSSADLDALALRVTANEVGIKDNLNADEIIGGANITVEIGTDPVSTERFVTIIGSEASKLVYTQVAVDTFAEAFNGYYVDTTLPISITLPNTASNDLVFVGDATGNSYNAPITVLPAPTNTIMGQASFTMNVPFNGFEFVKVGTDWKTKGSTYLDVGRNMEYLTVSADTSAEAFHGYYVDTTTAVNITLPVGVNDDMIFVGDVTGNAALMPITLTPNGTDTIMGLPFFTLNLDYQMFEIVKLGTDWRFVSGIGETTQEETPPPISASMNYAVITANQETAAFHGYICDTSTRAITVILHAAVNNDVIQVSDGSGNAQVFNVIIVPKTGETIMGLPSFTLNAAYQAVGLVKLGTDWKFISTVGESVSPSVIGSAMTVYTQELQRQMQAQGLTLNTTSLMTIFNNTL
jgi:hypothetical protein